MYFVFGCAGTSLLSGQGFLAATALGRRAQTVFLRTVPRRLGGGSSWALQRRLSSCGARAELLLRPWGLPRWNARPLHCQAGSLPLGPQGGPLHWVVQRSTITVVQQP